MVITFQRNQRAPAYTTWYGALSGPGYLWKMAIRKILKWLVRRTLGRQLWMGQSDKSTRKHLIPRQPEHEQGIVSRLAANSDECRRSLQSPTFFPFVKRYTRMLRIEDVFVASFGRRWIVKTPQRHLANWIITMFCAKNHPSCRVNFLSRRLE